MRLAVGGGSYMLHGTNNPMAVGMAITHGCIRMYPEDVAALFPLVPVGTKVWLINDPVKVAYAEGRPWSPTWSCCRSCWTRRWEAIRLRFTGTLRARRCRPRMECPR